MRRLDVPAVPAEQVQAVVEASRALIGVSLLSLAEMDEQVTLLQFRALVALADGPLKASELADRAGTSASTVTRLCDRLVADGLLHRVENPRSRREGLLSITAAGA